LALPTSGIKLSSPTSYRLRLVAIGLARVLDKVQVTEPLRGPCGERVRIEKNPTPIVQATVVNKRYIS
jgi:hypothetical protein